MKVRHGEIPAENVDVDEAHDFRVAGDREREGLWDSGGGEVGEEPPTGVLPGAQVNQIGATVMPIAHEIVDVLADHRSQTYDPPIDLDTDEVARVRVGEMGHERPLGANRDACKGGEG
jgi:hypothetical protein